MSPADPAVGAASSERTASPGPGLLGGNDVRPLGAAAVRALLEAVAGARDHVNLGTYRLRADEDGARLARAFAERRSRGVSVHVLYDSVGSLDTPSEHLERLRAAGVSVCEFNPVNPRRPGPGWRTRHRLARELLIVDGCVAFAGGLRLEGPAVGHLQRLFVEAWNQQDCEPLAPARYFPRNDPCGTAAAGALGQAPGTGPPAILRALYAALGAARRRAWLTCGAPAEPPTAAALAAAAQRGVDARLVLAPQRLRTAVVDGEWTAIGSTNQPWRAAVNNYEVDLVIRDPGLARHMEERFRLDARSSAGAELDQSSRRGLPGGFRAGLAKIWETLS